MKENTIDLVSTLTNQQIAEIFNMVWQQVTRMSIDDENTGYFTVKSTSIGEGKVIIDMRFSGNSMGLNGGEFTNTMTDAIPPKALNISKEKWQRYVIAIIVELPLES